jgi:hypothetical protein
VGVSDEDALRKTIFSVAETFGTPVQSRHGSPRVESLTPMAKGSARPASLSREFGLGEFPFHVDTAHWATPCRYVVLACVNPGVTGTPTYLLDRERICLTEAETHLARAGVFHIRNGRNSFYSSILDPNRDFVRLDVGCMHPETPAAVRALALFSTPRVRDSIHRITWRPGLVITIDNWRVLHARGAVSQPDLHRKLLRCIAA